MANRVCVVGAGPAGLVATKTLRDEGLDVHTFEASDAIAGHWVMDNCNGRSSAYESLQTNTTHAMSRLSDFTMPADLPAFPRHDQVRDWFESYVDHFGFRDRIALETEVVQAEAREPRGFRVTLRGSDGVTRDESFDAVVACTGSYWAARTPELPGSFDGDQLHAQQYRSPTRPVDLRGRRVVVVGIGNTGCELACEIAEAGASAVSLSARSGTWILPKTVDGKPASEAAPMTHPCDEVPTPLRLLPAGLREGLFARLGTVMFARMFGERMKRFEALGLPPPPKSPLDKRATVCDPLLDALESGAVAARPAIERLDGDGVVFADGRREAADAIVYATGYALRYPFLDPQLVDTADDDLVLFCGTMHPRRRDLFIVGVSRPVGAFWPIAEVHAQFAAAALSGRYEPPAQREIDRRARSILGGRSFNPALFGLAMREEVARGEKRAKRRRG